MIKNLISYEEGSCGGVIIDLQELVWYCSNLYEVLQRNTEFD